MYPLDIPNIDWTKRAIELLGEKIIFFNVKILFEPSIRFLHLLVK